MESFDSLLSKSIKTGKEFRFYVGAVLILSAAFSFLFFLRQFFSNLFWSEGIRNFEGIRGLPDLF